MAKLIGKEEDYKKYISISERVKKVYDKYLIAADGEIEKGHQAAYVRALAFDLVQEEKKEKVVQQLIKEVEANDYCLNTGFYQRHSCCRYWLTTVIRNSLSEYWSKPNTQVGYIQSC